MEKLLPRPERLISIPLPKQEELPRRKEWKAPSVRLPSLPNFLERRRAMDPVIFLVLVLSLCSFTILTHLYGPAYRVAVDGVELGLVEDCGQVEEAIRRVEDRASGILGYDYTIHQQVEYTFSIAPKEERTSVSTVETYLFDQIGEVMKSSVLWIGGEKVAATDDAQALDAMLQEIKAPYIHDNTITACFEGQVAVTREYIPTADILENDALSTLLNSNSLEKQEYVVLPGDTFSGIAAQLNMNLEELATLNPQVTDIANLMVGDVLTVRRAVPFLSVRTMDREVYTDALPFETETVEDNTMYEGNTTILVKGVPGVATYDANVTYLNGMETERVVNSVTVVEEPVTQRVAVGTLPRPKTMATGRLIWPLRGHITSGYGGRYIFGSYSFHSGVDIAASYGASIVASDGGKVVFAGTGTGSYWSYGKYVEIDHENGLRTIYAHCSSLNVSTGDRVFQGQLIGRVGATGRATGNHCHFQVKLWGETVNPYKYLP